MSHHSSVWQLVHVAWQFVAIVCVVVHIYMCTRTHIYICIWVPMATHCNGAHAHCNGAHEIAMVYIYTSKSRYVYDDVHNSHELPRRAQSSRTHQLPCIASIYIYMCKHTYIYDHVHHNHDLPRRTRYSRTCTLPRIATVSRIQKRFLYTYIRTTTHAKVTNCHIAHTTHQLPRRTP